MNSLNFVTKTISKNPSLISSTVPRPISKRISPELYQNLSGLNFAGVFYIGSKYDRTECYIGGAYNITEKLTHIVNLLYRGVHHSTKFQEWVNKNGINNLDINILCWCPKKRDVLTLKEQFFIDLYKPKFNTVLHKNIRDTEIEEERKNWMPTVVMFDENDEVRRLRGDFNIIKKKVVVPESKVYRNVFKGR